MHIYTSNENHEYEWKLVQMIQVEKLTSDDLSEQNWIRKKKFVQGQST